jgi:redox-sensitive bicupin YhaK (pirin superfamily)
MIDFELEAGALVTFQVPAGMDTAILYVYQGTIDGLNHGQDPIAQGHVVLLDASSPEHRGVELTTADSGAKVLYFGGRKLREPVAWHGSIVMNTAEQLQQAFRELRAGKLPPVRVDWDYKRIASKPSELL